LHGGQNASAAYEKSNLPAARRFVNQNRPFPADFGHIVFIFQITRPRRADYLPQAILRVFLAGFSRFSE
jgi:hypothetical protein